MGKPAAKCVIAILLLLDPSRLVWADSIVFTGAGPKDLRSTDLGAPVLEPSSWLAAEFSTETPVLITSIEGWIGVTQPGRMSVNLYSTSGVIPGQRLFTSGVQLPGTGTMGNWFGGRGLTWFIEPGTYWATFEVPLSPDAAFAFMLRPAPHPVSLECQILAPNLAFRNVAQR